MNYKAGDVINCYTRIEGVEFVVTIELVKAHSYECRYYFTAMPNQVYHISELDADVLDRFKDNYLLATSPLMKALE